MFASQKAIKKTNESNINWRPVKQLQNGFQIAFGSNRQTKP